MVRQSVIPLLHLGLALIVTGAPLKHAQAKDYFLTIGGGYSPAGNQISLESNVLFFQRMLAEQRPDGPAHDVYFADGDSPERDLQYFDPAVRDSCPPAARIMTETFGRGEAVGLCYRNHEVPNVTGAAEKAAIMRRFAALGRELKDGDRLFVYVTGHGAEASGRGRGAGGSDDYDYRYDEESGEWVAKSKSDRGEGTDNDFDTSLYLWNNQRVSASEFGRWLDRLPAEVNVVLVMVQCYSGGFAHSIFHQNDAELGLSSHRRCGFFSQVHDRPAAGCTPEMREADYREYSTYFWAALGGKDREGKPVERPDYNGDGKISLAEAHAYVIIESDTIDIPICTSDELLRRYGRQGEGRGDASGQQENPVGKLLGAFGAVAKSDGMEPEFKSASGPLADLLPLARPEQRAILERLPEKLGLSSPVTAEAVRRRLAAAEGEVNKINGQIGRLNRALQKASNDLKADVYEQWPELMSGFAPVVAELLGSSAGEFAAEVEKLASYQAYKQAVERREELNKKLSKAQIDEAAAQRLIRCIESVVLAANLEKSAPEEIMKRHAELLELEGQTLQ
jgi:hypothetical protein